MTGAMRAMTHIQDTCNHPYLSISRPAAPPRELGAPDCPYASRGNRQRPGPGTFLQVKLKLDANRKPVEFLTYMHG